MAVNVGPTKGDQMTMPGVTTYHVDYLQRLYDPPPLTDGLVTTSSAPGARRAWHVRGIGRLSRVGGQVPQTADAGTPMRDALIGVYGYKIPLGFLIRADSSGLSLRLGIWSSSDRERISERTLNARAQLLNSVVTGCYPSADLSWTDPSLPLYPLGGFVLGHPSSRPLDALDGALPLDRLIRALRGSAWAALVLADPIDESAVSGMRNATLNEIRAVQAEARASAAPSPLGEFYQELLTRHLVEQTRGQAEGAWRTGVYLLGDNDSYYRLSSVWRSIFSGEESISEPVRVFDDVHATELARRWALPDVGGVVGPGRYQHPFSYQSMLTSTQLAQYIQLPRDETSGFQVVTVPEFDCVPAESDEPNRISLGHIIDRNRVTAATYDVSRSALNHHALVVGVTGSGKSTTCRHLLAQLWERQIPFLVIEPSKTEYRHLLDDPIIGPELRVFTLGDELASPFRMNPFEVGPGVPIATHIDLLKSVFNAAFSMWTVLPQILEQSLHQVYRDYGWNVVRNKNDRTSGDHDQESFPTLADLQDTIAKVVDRLGYEPNTSSELKAALLTRIQSLRIGGKGRMLDTRSSYPIANLLDRPTVFELEAVGDDDEKAFIMGILLTRLYEHLRSQGPSRSLGHVLVVEEAHRLLSNVRVEANPEVANTRGKAVETFVNMLSEVRAYGEGFVIAEQIPDKLAPDVLKNTNVKIVHRTVSGTDRAVLAGTMNMTEEQSDMLATLSRGRAAVYSEGDDRPILVEVGQHEMRMDARIAPERLAASGRRAFPAGTPVESTYLESVGRVDEWDSARAAADSVGFQQMMGRLVLNLVERPASLAAMLDDVVAEASRVQPGLKQSPAFLRGLVVQGLDTRLRSLGRDYGWSFTDTADLRNDLVCLVLDAFDRRGAAPDPPADARLTERGERFGDRYRALSLRDFDPYEGCSVVCGHCPAPCLFRHHAAGFVHDDKIHRQFTAILQAAEGIPQVARDLVALGRTVADQFAGEQLPEESRRKATFCFLAQQLADRSDTPVPVRRRFTAELLAVTRAPSEEGNRP